MDKLKKKRTSLRTSFTKAFNGLHETLSATEDSKEILVSFQILEEKMNDLETTTNQFYELLLDGDAAEEEVQREYDDADEYKRRFLTAKLLVTECTSPQVSEMPRATVSTVQGEVRKTFKLPKIELVKFSGNVRDWLQFWSLFKKIHEDRNIAKEDKFQYLLQATESGSRAEELVKSYPPTGENYEKVITSLKNRFGREDLQIEVYVRELLQLVLQKAISPDKNILLSSLYDKIESQLRALESLGVTTDKCAAMLFPLVESCLPEELLRAWQRSGSVCNATTDNAEGATQSKDRLTHLIKFLEGEVQNELRISMAVKGFDLKTSNCTDSDKNKKYKVRADNKDIPSATGLLTTKDKVNPCLFCDANDHESANCEKAKKMNLTEKQECVKKKHACFNCLRMGHGFKTCRVKVKCAWCNRRHVIIMCPEMGKRGAETENIDTVKNECSLTNYCSDPEVFMQTLRVKLRNDHSEIVIRAVIDTGSQKSYITEEAATRMCYESVAEQVMTHSLFGGRKSDTVKHKKYIVRLRSLDGSYSCNFTALDQKVICGDIPSVKNGLWFEELKKLHVKISDVDSDDESVSVLIGADVAGKLLTGQRHILECGLVAVETCLGWTIMGKVPETEKHEDAVLITTSMFVSNNVTDLWALDVLGIKDPIENKTQNEHDREVIETFLKTVTINKEGRYEVQLPWLENHPPLNDNKDVAVRRLQATVKKLKTDGLYEDYCSILDEWTADGIIEHVPENEVANWGHYLPHRHVVKENSTTRIRPVFDASAKELRFPSLNECLEKGPNLIELVASILLRFREGNIGVISDIKKAFLQISIHVKDRDFLRFLWFDSLGNTIILRHCRVVFGVTCSPFVLGAVIDMHLNNILESSNESNAMFCEKNVLKLRKSFYVDNCVTSVNTVVELDKFILDARTVMELAGFDLRGWEYNGDNSDEDQAAVLGIVWNKQRDSLSLNVPTLDQICKQKITKRDILSVAHRIFDPLGLVCPIVLRPKILLQETWSRKLSWDDEVSEDIKGKFLSWADELKDLNEIEVPRCMLGVNIDKVSIHTFCDASKLAYATVVFIRTENGSNVRVNFVQAKTRVAPVKKEKCDAQQSIPRLELLAATIGVRLTKSVMDSLNLTETKVYYWTDSSTVLAWIRRECNWNVFVWNRVKEIRKLSDPEQWHHVPGHLNPADLPSRGCTVSQLASSRWWEGPEWLSMGSENWPNSETIGDEEEINKELKKTVEGKKSECATLISLLKNDCEKVTPWYAETFSNYTKIIRLVAWIKRFYFNCKSNVQHRKKDDLSCEEIASAEISLIRMIQIESFVDENDTRIKHFLPFKDKDSVIRLNTKIVLRRDVFNFRCPIILPGNHIVVNLIIKDRHEELKHAGVEITMGSLREKFWILGGRKAIRSVIKQCVICRRYDAKPLESAPAPLPLDRIRDAAVFEVVGVDFTGPIFLKGKQKAWICLFTCAVFRAVHLELVTSLSTASFLMALRRHIARRGRPTIIYSDNGTNFVGLNNMFKLIDFQKLARIVKTEQIEWRFNPPAAAWWGGFWERLNGILKRLLKRTLKRSCLDYEEMLTVLLDCEAVINSRPITFMSDSQQEVVPLTPSMFLQEIKEIGVLDLDQIEHCRLEQRYVYRQKIKDDLRHRFRNEYLGALVHRESNVKRGNNVKVGDIVLIGSDNVKRLDWPLARVKDVITGKDGNIRVVRLTTTSGELIRPIQKIYPLELKGNFDMDISKIVTDRYETSSKSRTPKETHNVSDKSDLRVDDCEKPYFVTKSGRKVKEPERLSYH